MGICLSGHPLMLLIIVELLIVCVLENKLLSLHALRKTDGDFFKTDLSRAVYNSANLKELALL